MTFYGLGRFYKLKDEELTPWQKLIQEGFREWKITNNNAKMTRPDIKLIYQEASDRYYLDPSYGKTKSDRKRAELRKQRRKMKKKEKKTTEQKLKRKEFLSKVKSSPKKSKKKRVTFSEKPRVKEFDPYLTKPSDPNFVYVFPRDVGKERIREERTRHAIKKHKQEARERFLETQGVKKRKKYTPIPKSQLSSKVTQEIEDILSDDF